VLIDLDAKVAERAGERLTLTPTEYRILEMLAGEPGLPVSRCKLLEGVWGYSSVTNTRTLETHVWRLRKKLGDKRSEATWIANRQGFGYVLLVPIS
jgi:DNA-binding response OmpR family regulator